ncbi:MAG: class I SAM-dependent methyltransferase [Patescibacteria group bacterium]
MKNVEKYFDDSSKYYSLLYADRESLGYHYGYWDKNIQSRKQALLNVNQKVADLLRVQSGDRVLDAGCGVGGTSLWLAKHVNAQFIGITLSGEQVKMARRIAERRKLSKRVMFQKMDFLSTSFAEQSFDKIFAIEAFCHSYFSLTTILKEMHRILKKRGMLVMCDGFLHFKPRDRHEQQWLRNFCKGWHVDTLLTHGEIIQSFEQAGFRNVTFIDRTALAKKGSRQIYRLGLWAYPVVKLLQLLRLASRLVPDNIFASMAQKKMFDRGIMGHGTFSAAK